MAVNRQNREIKKQTNKRTRNKDKENDGTGKGLKTWRLTICKVVLSAISSVSRRIKEVAQTHKPLFGGEHFLTGKEVCERLYISPRTLQDYRDRGNYPLHSVCREDTL